MTIPSSTQAKGGGWGTARTPKIHYTGTWVLLIEGFRQGAQKYKHWVWAAPRPTQDTRQKQKYCMPHIPDVWPAKVRTVKRPWSQFRRRRYISENTFFHCQHEKRWRKRESEQSTMSTREKNERENGTNQDEEAMREWDWPWLHYARLMEALTKKKNTQHQHNKTQPHRRKQMWWIKRGNSKIIPWHCILG